MGSFSAALLSDKKFTEFTHYIFWIICPLDIKIYPLDNAYPQVKLLSFATLLQSIPDHQPPLNITE